MKLRSSILNHLFCECIILLRHPAVAQPRNISRFNISQAPRWTNRLNKHSVLNLFQFPPIPLSLIWTCEITLVMSRLSTQQVWCMAQHYTKEMWRGKIEHRHFSSTQSTSSSSMHASACWEDINDHEFSNCQPFRYRFRLSTYSKFIVFVGKRSLAQHEER